MYGTHRYTFSKTVLIVIAVTLLRQFFNKQLANRAKKYLRQLPAVYVLFVFCLHYGYLLYIFGTEYSVHKMNIAVLFLGLYLLAREVAAGAQAPSPPLGGLPQEEGPRPAAPANSFSAHSKLHLLGECCFVCGHFLHQHTVFSCRSSVLGITSSYTKCFQGFSLFSSSLCTVLEWGLFSAHGGLAYVVLFHCT